MLSINYCCIEYFFVKGSTSNLIFYTPQCLLGLITDTDDNCRRTVFTSLFAAVNNVGLLLQFYEYVNNYKLMLFTVCCVVSIQISSFTLFFLFVI